MSGCSKFLCTYISRFCPHVAYPPYPCCGRPNLALDTAIWSGSVIAGAIKIQHATRSKHKINRDLMFNNNLTLLVYIKEISKSYGILDTLGKNIIITY